MIANQATARQRNGFSSSTGVTLFLALLFVVHFPPSQLDSARLDSDAAKAGTVSSKTLEQYAAGKGLSAAEVQQKFGATGAIKCDGRSATAQVTFVRSVITTTGRLFTGSDCKHQKFAACHFEIIEDGNVNQIRVQLPEFEGNACRTNNVWPEWAVVQLERPVASSIVPYQIPEKDFVTKQDEPIVQVSGVTGPAADKPAMLLQIADCHVTALHPFSGRPDRTDCYSAPEASGSAQLIERDGVMTMVSMVIGGEPAPASGKAIPDGTAPALMQVRDYFLESIREVGKSAYNKIEKGGEIEPRMTLAEYAEQKGVPLASIEQKFAATGILDCEGGGGTQLTAQLTGSRWTITTAAHAFRDKQCNSEHIERCRFFLHDGTAWRKEYAVAMETLRIGKCNTADDDDWAVFRLRKAVADVRHYGILEMTPETFGKKMNIINVAAFAMNFLRGTDYPRTIQECESVHSEVLSLLRTTCNNGRGASGSAYLVERNKELLVAGTHNGTAIDVHVGTPLKDDFLSAILEAINAGPAGEASAKRARK